MDAVTAEPLTPTAPLKRRFGITPVVELLVLALAITMAGATYLIIDRSREPLELLTPPLVALLLVANLLLCGALIVLVGRRIAQSRAARSPVGGRADLHVRLVAIFSLMACVPTVLLAVIASLLFQYGAEFWFSGRARAVLDNSRSVTEASYKQLISYVDNENVAMAHDVWKMLFENHWKTESKEFQSIFEQDVFQRSLSNSILFSLGPKGEIRPAAIIRNSDLILTDQISADDMRKLNEGHPSVAGTNEQRTYSLARIEGTDLLLYSTREGGAPEMASRLQQVKSVFTDYETLLRRSRALQLQFNAALLAISLAVIAIVVFIALAVADRLVRPVNELVGAARRIADGDLAVRVPVSRAQDEISTLGNAFNGMTERLEQQTGALKTANAQLESRRVLIEAVMSGVSAGVISIDAQRNVRLINESAIELLHQGGEDLVGHPLVELAPELNDLLDTGDREAVIQLGTGGDARTLAVKVTSDEAGKVLTFDDITQQLNDQRRAAWSDVARRIAHEIKNPLTPIQLAAERLKRRYGKKIEPEDGTFAQLTDTIVRQVGDLRRMVDEFSSFARMPKPMFRQESLLDIARQAMFLHEVAHPTVRFEMDAPDPAPGLICDRRQIGQAFTNIVKNAVEAIEARGEGEALPQGHIVMTISPEAEGRITLTLADNGIGLPVERDRIVEPYMTTRSRGTGLGLAIVKKIVEEHFGTIGFTDRPGGGTLVTISFDTDQLAEMVSSPEGEGGEEPRPAVLTRTGSAKS